MFNKSTILFILKTDLKNIILNFKYQIFICGSIKKLIKDEFRKHNVTQ